VGERLRRKSKPTSDDDWLGPEEAADVAWFRGMATMIFVGIGGMFFGSKVMKLGPEFAIISTLIVTGSLAMLVWGSVNYARMKGYSGWWGLLGYLLLLGQLVLFCLPNRRNRLALEGEPETNASRALLRSNDAKPGFDYLLGLTPTVAMLAFSSYLLSPETIPSGNWRSVAAPELGFRATMPGEFKTQNQTEETPVGPIQIRKFFAKPRHGELYMIVVIHSPPEVVQKMGGLPDLLEAGRQNVLQKGKGKVKSERPIELAGCRGLELEIIPTDGAIVKSQVFAQETTVYEITLYSSKIRMISTDVQKFFDSFELVKEQSTP